MLNKINRQEVDLWNKNSDKQALIDCCQYFVLDMDGTFYLDDEILLGSLDFIKQVQKTGRDFLFFTNNSSKNAYDYREKLARMHCPITEQQIMTSGDVTIAYLQSHYADKTVYGVSTQVLLQSFSTADISLVEENSDVVVLDFDQSLTYEKIKKAAPLSVMGLCTLQRIPTLIVR